MLWPPAGCWSPAQPSECQLWVTVQSGCSAFINHSLELYLRPYAIHKGVQLARWKEDRAAWANSVSLNVNSYCETNNRLLRMIRRRLQKLTMHVPKENISAEKEWQLDKQKDSENYKEYNKRAASIKLVILNLHHKLHESNFLISAVKKFPLTYWAAQLFKFNKKHFLSSKSAYQNNFWRIMWHWRLE